MSRAHALGRSVVQCDCVLGYTVTAARFLSLTLNGYYKRSKFIASAIIMAAPTWSVTERAVMAWQMKLRLPTKSLHEPRTARQLELESLEAVDLDALRVLECLEAVDLDALRVLECLEAVDLDALRVLECLEAVDLDALRGAASRLNLSQPICSKQYRICNVASCVSFVLKQQSADVFNAALTPSKCLGSSHAKTNMFHVPEIWEVGS